MIDTLVNFLDAIPFNAIAQIAVLYFAVYGVLRAGRGTRFGQALMGFGVLFGLLAVLSHIFDFDVISRLLQALLGYVVISTVVVFHPEIRRFLASFGAMLFRDRDQANTQGQVTPEQFTRAIFKLSEKRLGALFAFERGISLKGYEESGVVLDAIISEPLLVSIFTEPLPLHDGGAVVRHGRLASAHCLFPISNQESLSVSGMRHRAAVGLSEETDALVVVVSEETGRVSIAHNGKIIRYPDADDASRAAVLRWISKAMPRRKSTLEKIADSARKIVHKMRRRGNAADKTESGEAEQ
ncbi:MAG: diadenylate cyclase [Kiritimatiellae bacterium]|nr:diadenylate cyclase [Kiritimatiellia bacterium]